MHRIATLIVIFSLFLGIAILWNHNQDARNFLHQRLATKEILALDIRLNPHQILKAHQSDLLQSSRQRLSEPKVVYYPYLILDVERGIQIWGLHDGELIAEVENWTTDSSQTLTQINRPLITHTYRHIQPVSQHYTKEQIMQKSIQNIKSARLLYLPVVRIDIHQPDGSIEETFWNAYTGSRMYMKS